MKRFLSIMITLCLCSAALFAYEDDEEYDDGYVYEQNGAGDQFLKIELGALFPLNFDKTLHPGFEANIGYYRFLTSTVAVGGELMVSNNFSIGGKPLFMIPVTAGVMYQPTYGKFEFPMFANVGFTTETWANMSYWPALTFKGSAGVYYRMTESWSFGGNTAIMTISEIANGKTKQNKTGVFMTAALNARYHF